jgi:rod shape determining protein RodA
MMRSYSNDFLRRLPDSQQHFSRGSGIWQRVHLDPVLLLGLVLLTVYGLVVLYSGGGQSQYLIKRQLVFFGIAYMGMLVVAQVKMHVLQRWAPWLYLLGIALLVFVLVKGVGAKGAQRWIGLGFIRFQPSEILKLAVPMLVASYFSTRMLPPRFRHVFWCLVFVAIPAALILQQPDLGTAILVAASGLIGLFLAGLPWRYVVGAVGAFLVSLWPVWQFGLHDYQRQRVLTLLNPEADRLGAGWNIIQSKTAIGSGGLQGKGWLNGTQSHLDFLPESHTDFIIAVLAEEFGLLGVLLLLGLYVLIIGRGLMIAVQAQSTFNRILAGSITLTFFVYVFVNIGMVAGLLPVVGVPLPLVSLGGTSLVTIMVSFGILMAIATEKKKVTI